MYKLEQEYHHLSLWYFVSFIFGIIFFFRVELNYSFFSIIFCIVLFTSAALVLRSRSLLLLFASYLLLSFFIGIFVSHLRMSNIQTNPISKPMFSEISGRVDTIKPGLRGTQITLKDVTLADSTYLNKIRVNVSNKLISNVSYGDVINLRAKLFPLQGSVLPGTYDFGFYMYMSGIEASGYALTGIEVTEKNKSFVDQYIQTIRQKIYKQLINVLGANNGNFASAILIGETKAIPLKIADDMRNSGVAHVLSVSGLHLSLVAMIFFITSRMILNCSNYIAYNYNIKIIAAIISVIGSFLYLQISGANIAATRAFIMTSIFIASIILGRIPYPLRSVMIAAVLILAFLPEYIFHPSFQLSFTAVLCLIGGYEFYMKNKNILGNSKGVFATIKLYIFANIYSSFLAGFVTAPYVIFHFYKFANYSVLMNLIAVPLMSFFMMPLVIIATILMPMGLDEWPLKLLGFFITIVVESAAYIVSLPGSIWITGRISELSLLVFTFGFFWLCLWKTSWRLIGIIIMLMATYI